MRVYMKHVRKAKMCSGGARTFFQRHNLDWTDFLKNGIESNTLKQIDDAMSNYVIKIAEEELNG